MKKWFNKLIGRIFGDPIETSRKEGYMFAVTELRDAPTELAFDLTKAYIDNRCRASYTQPLREQAWCEGAAQAMADLSDRH